MMRVEDVETLLVAFYEGKTTDNEERILKKYFEEEDVPEYLQKEQRLFKALYTFPNSENPSYKLEKKLIKLIDNEAEKEKRFLRRNKTKINQLQIGAIAASFLIMIFIGYKINNYRINETPQDTYCNPQEAYKAMQTALTEVSTNINKGFYQLEENKKEIHKVNQEVIKEIK